MLVSVTSSTMKVLIGICLVLCSPLIRANQFAELQGGYKMPVLGLGTWQAKDDVLDKAVDFALESGYRHIDTATVYENEEVIGKVLNRWLTSGKVSRNELFITTKLPNVAMHPEHVLKFIKESLEKLQLDYVDMYLIHGPFGLNYKEGVLRPTTSKGTPDIDVTTDLLAIWKVMEELVGAGLTKSIGVSNFNETQITRILNNATIAPANLQVELHAYLQQKDLVNFCKSKNIVVTAYSPLGSPAFNSERSPPVLNDPTVSEIAGKHNKTAAQVLLRHCVQRGLVCIPKSTTPSRIQENINIFDFELNDKDMEQLNGLDKGPSGRIIDFHQFKGNHPEFPF